MFRLAAENLHSLINETLIPITPTQTLPTISAYQHFTWSPKFLMQFNINNVSRHNIGRQHIPGPGTSEKVSRVRRTQTSHITPSLITGRGCIIILRSASPDISQCQHCPCVGTSGPSQPLGTCFDCFCPDLTSAVIKFNYSPLTPQPVCWSQGIYHVRRDLSWRRGFCGGIFICFDDCYDLTLTPSWQSLGSREIWTLIRDHCNFHFIPWAWNIGRQVISVNMSHKSTGYPCLASDSEQLYISSRCHHPAQSNPDNWCCGLILWWILRTF